MSGTPAKQRQEQNCATPAKAEVMSCSVKQPHKIKRGTTNSASPESNFTLRCFTVTSYDGGRGATRQHTGPSVNQHLQVAGVHAPVRPILIVNSRTRRRVCHGCEGASSGHRLRGVGPGEERGGLAARHAGPDVGEEQGGQAAQDGGRQAEAHCGAARGEAGRVKP